MVVALKRGKPPLILLTGTSAPCLSIFKPHTLVMGQKSVEMNDFSRKLQGSSVDIYGSATDYYNPDTLWWRGEDIHRNVITNYSTVSPQWISVITEIEKKVIDKIEQSWESKETAEFKKECNLLHTETLLQFITSTEMFLGELSKERIVNNMPFLVKRQWRKWNRKAKISVKT
jgi:dipeptidase